MEKYKVTKKVIRQSYDKILSIGYCDLQHLLKYETPFAYSTRAEGWACDYYNIDGVIISTGYAPIGKNIDYEITHRYDDMGKQLDNSLSYTEKKEKTLEYLTQFIEEVTA